MAQAAFTLRIQGLRELQQRLRREGTELVQAPYRQRLDEAAKAARNIVRQGAPRDTGKLQDKLIYRVQNAPVPRYAVIKTTATRSSKRYRRYSYPSRLEFDPRSTHQNWLLTGITRAAGTVQTILNKLGRDLEGRWSR